MPRLPQISGKKLIALLEKFGYEQVRQKGSHVRLSHSEKVSLTIPLHKIIGKGLLRKIIRESEIDPKDLFKNFT